MLAQQSRHLFVQLVDLLVDQLQLLQEHLEQSTVDWVELGAGAECIAQLCRCGAQILICQSARAAIGLSVGKRLQHPPCTRPQQIRHQAGQLNVGFFQQSLQAVL
jgi:hypothetical protein